MESNVNCAEKSSQLEFMQLNDFCLLEIMKKMKPADLCSMSFTCKKFQQFAHDIFYLYFPQKWIEIESNGANEMKFSDTGGKYLKYLSKSVRNVRVVVDSPPVNRSQPENRSHNNNSLEHLLDFILENCCPKLISLKLDIQDGFTVHHGEKIKSILNGLSFLSFSDEYPDTDVYHNILRHCTSLKKFDYKNGTRTKPESVRWILNEQLKLEELAVNVAYIPMANEIERLAKQYLQQNPQLRLFSYFAKRKIVNVRLTNGIVECVSLNYFDEVTINRIRNDLELFTLDGTPGKLWIRAQSGCSVQSLNEIVKLDRIHPILKFTTQLYPFCHYTSIQYLHHLTALELTFANALSHGFTIPSYLELVCKGIPNLKKFIMNFSFPNLSPKLRFDAITKPFIAKLSKLIYFRINVRDDKTIACDKNDVIVMNAARSALMNACPLTVSLSYSYICPIPQFDVPDRSLVRMDISEGFLLSPPAEMILL